MAPHSSTLAWKIPWMEEPGRLQSMGSLRVGHDWVTSLSLFTLMHWRRKWQPTPVFLPGESQRQWAAIYGVAQSRTRLKWLSKEIHWIRQGRDPVWSDWLVVCDCSFQSVCPPISSLSAYRLTWVSLTLDVGSPLRATPVKHSPCFLSRVRGSSSLPHSCVIAAATIW